MDSNGAPKGHLTRMVGRGVGWNAVILTMQTMLNIVSLSILARLLSPSEYGVMGAAQVFVQLGIVVASLGLGPTLIQRKELDRDTVGTILFLSLASGTALALFMWLAAPVIAGIMRVRELEDVCRVLSLLMVLQAFANIGEAMVTRSFRFRTVAVWRFASWCVAIFGVSIPAAYSGFSYWSLVAARLAELSLYAIAIGFAARADIALPKLHFPSLFKIWRTSLGYGLSSLGTFAAGNIDNVFVARYLGQADLGIYTRAYTLLSMPANLFGGLAEVVLFPTMARLQDDERRLAGGYLKAIQLTAVTTLPASTFIYVFAPQIVEIVLGPKWLDVILPIRLFAFAIYLRLGYKAFALALHARGKAHVVAASQAAYGALIAIGAFIGSQFGLAYVCLGVVSALAVNFLALGMLGTREARVSRVQVAAAHVPAIFAAAVVGIVGLAMQAATANAPAAATLATGLIGTALVYLLVLRLRPALVLGAHGTDVLITLASDHLRWFFTNGIRERGLTD